MAKITVLMIDGVADWEIGPVLPAAREWFDDEVRIASIDGKPLTSIGGLQIHPEAALADLDPVEARSEEHTSELQSLMRISYAVFCLKKKKKNVKIRTEVGATY